MALLRHAFFSLVFVAVVVQAQYSYGPATYATVATHSTAATTAATAGTTAPPRQGSGAINWDVQVGNGGFTFTPSTLQINAGDNITFHYVSSIHNTVILKGGQPLSCSDPGLVAIQACSWQDGAACTYSNGATNTAAAGSTFVFVTDQADNGAVFQFLCSIHCQSENMHGDFVVGNPPSTTTSAAAKAAARWVAILAAALLLSLAI